MAKKKDKTEPLEPLGAEKPNVSQAGLIRALKSRGYKQENNTNPYILKSGDSTVVIKRDSAETVVKGKTIGVPLGKGAIVKLEKEIKATENKAA